MLPALFMAATITIAPTDDYKKIEAAQPGDEVVIAPGTYDFRVYLTQQAPANNPIVIRAQDPKNPPVWDLSAQNVEDAPGSYTAGDRGRGCWQLSGATNITIESIVFTGCHTASFNSAGIRYYETTKGLLIRDCLFKDNDDGLTGGSQDSDATVEFSEFDSNGNLNASQSSPTHNIYIYGGTFTLRYSYLHDPTQGQNFHIRATEALIESNWITHGKSYEGDLMPNDDFTGAGPFSQSMIFRGNTIVQGTPSNHSQIIAMYNDAGLANLTLHVEAINNTIIAAAPQGAIVHLSNADHTKMSAVISNNVLTVSTTAFDIEDMTNGSVSGQNNWFLTGTAVAPLTGSVFGSDPQFAASYRPGNALIGAAASVQNTPITEYYLDDKTTRMYRVRASVKDIGAFESTTTGPGIGPYDTQPPLDGGLTLPDSGAANDAAGAGDSGPIDPGYSNGGCGCDVVGTSGSYGFGAALFALLAAARRRRRS
jgi:MYXO-CTERM domain-containing protein